TNRHPRRRGRRPEPQRRACARERTRPATAYGGAVASLPTVAAVHRPLWTLWSKRHTLVTPGSDRGVFSRVGGYTSRRDRRAVPAARKPAAYSAAPSAPGHAPSRSLPELPRVPATVAANTWPGRYLTLSCSPIASTLSAI